MPSGVMRWGQTIGFLSATWAMKRRNLWVAVRLLARAVGLRLQLFGAVINPRLNLMVLFNLRFGGLICSLNFFRLVRAMGLDLSGKAPHRACRRVILV